MKKINAKTVDEYLQSLPEDRKLIIEIVRAVILKNLPPGYGETINWGMLCYEIPLQKYPHTYNKQPLSYAALAAHKNYFSLYLPCFYNHAALKDHFQKELAASGKKLDMGKSCIRFRKVDDLPLELIGKTIARVSVDEFIQLYEKSRGQ